jgi:branched-subunit amino acid aminotransferase/4-amino-4-deoxychorismate lyase
MALLGWAYRLDRPRLCAALHRAVSASPAAENRVRIDVLAEPALGLGSRSRELIALQPFTPPPDELYETGVAVDFALDLAREQPLAKTADFAVRRPVTGGLAPGTAAPYEYLLLSPDGYILEGTGTNFYGVCDGVVYTAGEGVLEGITREIILGLIGELGIPLRPEAVHRDDVTRLDEAALSGSSRAFLPVVSIAGQTVGDGRPGPVSRRILKAYTAFVAENIMTAI